MTLPYLLQLGERIQSGLQRFPEEFRTRHRQFFLSRQLPEGGFSGRDVDLNGDPLFEDGVQADLYYTSFAVRGLAALGALDTATATRVAQWLIPHTGRVNSVIDIVSWLYSALAIQSAGAQDVLSTAVADWPQKIAAHLEIFRRTDGGYAKSTTGAVGSTYHSFLVALCYELIGEPLPQPEQLVAFVQQRQRDDGGFVEMPAMRRSGTNPTAAALGLLKICGALTPDIVNGLSSFLQEVTGDEGGFQANTRIPFSDTLSTFTGLVTCLDIGRPELIRGKRMRRFLNELELNTGGFLAAGWDQVADVEYTFYALGTLGLLENHAESLTS